MLCKAMCSIKSFEKLVKILLYWFWLSEIGLYWKSETKTKTKTNQNLKYKSKNTLKTVLKVHKLLKSANLSLNTDQNTFKTVCIKAFFPKNTKT